MRNVLRKKITTAKNKLKKHYEQKARLRELEVDQMVLMRIPGPTGKLDDSWYGLNEVNSKLNDVNYEMVVHNYRRNKHKVVHINNLKTWVEQQARVLRIICAVEESSEAPTKLKLLGNAMPARGQQALTSLLNEFEDIMSNLQGNTTSAVHEIDTGMALPIRLAQSSWEGTSKRRYQQSTCCWHY